MRIFTNGLFAQKSACFYIKIAKNWIKAEKSSVLLLKFFLRCDILSKVMEKKVD